MTSQQVTFTGWVDKISQRKTFAFVFVRRFENGRRILEQVILDGTAAFEVESFVSVTGTSVKVPEKAYTDTGFEIKDATITVLGPSSSEVTFRCPPDASQNIKLEHRHLYLRTLEGADIILFNDLCLRSLRKVFENMVEISPPMFVGNQCEGGADLFRVEHPASEKGMVNAYLSQSSQFYLEYAAPGVGDCYCIAPSFRAEKSHTRRHLTEFLHVEAEWINVQTYEEHCQKLKDLLVGLFHHLLDDDNYPFLIKMGVLDRLRELQAMTQDILILDHAEAIRMCNQLGFTIDGIPFTPFQDIPEAQERQLIDHLGKIVFLGKFPKIIKSFYMKPDPSDPDRVLGVDVEVCGVGEIIGSGMRESDPEALKEAILNNGLKVEDYKEYLDLRKYGAGQTSGMGLGFGRLVTWLLGKHNIREVVAFPRAPGLLHP